MRTSKAETYRVSNVLVQGGGLQIVLAEHEDLEELMGLTKKHKKEWIKVETLTFQGMIPKRLNLTLRVSKIVGFSDTYDLDIPAIAVVESEDELKSLTFEKEYDKNTSKAVPDKMKPFIHSPDPKKRH